jgi:hypothetical protein
MSRGTGFPVYTASTPGFPHGMAAIITFEADIGTPTLHFPGHRGHGEHLPKSAIKQIAVIVGLAELRVLCQIVPDGLDGGAVQRDHPIRARLGLFEVQGLPHLGTGPTKVRHPLFTA